MMDSGFRTFVDSLVPQYERLMKMTPVTYASLPAPLPKRAIYLFSEDSKHLYVGRTNNLRNRLRGHCAPSAGHFSATFASRIAREESGLVKATYTKEGSRAQLAADAKFWRPSLSWCPSPTGPLPVGGGRSVSPAFYAGNIPATRPR